MGQLENTTIVRPDGIPAKGDRRRTSNGKDGTEFQKIGSVPSFSLIENRNRLLPKAAAQPRIASIPITNDLCFVLCRNSCIPQMDPMLPPKIAERNSVFSGIRHAPVCAFFLSMPMRKKATDIDDRQVVNEILHCTPSGDSVAELFVSGNQIDAFRQQ